jgi:hypothetical protein
VTWKLNVEHKLKPPVRFYETKPHPTKASALKRALAIYRNAGWGLRVLFIEGTNGERIEAAEINDWCKRSPAGRVGQPKIDGYPCSPPNARFHYA